jgi:hypothetical protein
MQKPLAWGVLLAILSACGGGPPPRFIVERDIDQWSYRRYQRVLDVEIAIEGNEAVGHTATYVARRERRGEHIPYANVFVTAYDNAQGLAAELRRQVRSLASYEAEVRDFGGGRVWYLDAGPGDRWALWVSGRYIVKVGGSEELEEVPQPIVSTYMGIYPSDLDEHGRARDGTQSAGELPGGAPSPESETPAEGEPVPDFLRNDAPR